MPLLPGVATDIASRMAAAAGDLSSRMAGQFPNMVAATQTPGITNTNISVNALRGL